MLAYVILAVALAVLAVALYTLHKVRHMHLMLYAASTVPDKVAQDLYQQLQALQAIYIELGFSKGLPSTRGWAASPDFLRELYLHALAEQPQVVVECSSGTSTVILARCMQLNGSGKVYSLEHDPVFAEQTRKNLARHGLAQWATVIDAPLVPFKDQQRWYALDTLPSSLDIEMLVIDGPPASINPMARYPAGPALFPRLAPGGAVFLDDAARADEQATVQRWQQEFPELETGSRYCEKGCTTLRKGARLPPQLHAVSPA